MNMDTATIGTYLERLRDDLGSRYSPDTVRTFLIQSKAFLEYASIKPEYARADVLSYVDHLIGEDKKHSSVNLALSAIRALFRALAIPWPLSKTDLHLGIPVADEGGPVLPTKDIAKLIHGVRDYKPNLYTTITALSSTFGFRPIELQTALAQGCNGKELALRSAKGGRTRHHDIPPQVRPYLDFPPTKMSRARLHQVFQELMTIHVRAVIAGEGWHSIRRALVTELLEAGVPMPTVSRFMGWKMRETAFAYFRPAANRIDAQIYESHPFLGFWEG